MLTAVCLPACPKRRTAATTSSTPAGCGRGLETASETVVAATRSEGGDERSTTSVALGRFASGEKTLAIGGTVLREEVWK
jgi:hypothetical protein